MLLRSSSTPILGSIISSSPALFSDSPNNGFQLHPSIEKTGSCSSSNLHGISCQFVPLSDFSERNFSAGMRRTRSEGNIKDLLFTCSDDSQFERSLKSSSARGRDTVLETVPSLSIYSSLTVDEGEEENVQDQENYQIHAEFSFTEHAGWSRMDQSSGERSRRASQPLFLARGLGIDRLPSGFINPGGDDGGVMAGGDSGDGKGDHSVKTDYGGEGYEFEVFYKRAIEEDPGNAMFLKNYAQYLHQSKKNLPQAEEYYSRAILADPGDADAISQFGALIWELHGDFERASSYIERAASMDQNNCFVQAAYAAFLWETGEEAGDDDTSPERGGGPFYVDELASAST